MARRRTRGWPPDPVPLPLPVPDNHTHLDSIDDVLPVPAEPGTPAVPGGGGTSGGTGAPGSWRPDSDAIAPAEDPWAENSWAEGRRPSVADHLARARRAGIDRVLQCGCDLGAARWTDRLLRSGPAAPTGPTAARVLLGAVAIHPNEAVLHAGVIEPSPDGHTHTPGPQHAASLDDAITEIADLARANERIRAIGETGMDLFRTGPRGEAVQREAFRAHIAIAKELGLAMQIHDRDAHTQVLDILDRDGAPERTVFHCYSGDAELARRCVANGWYLSFAGPVTYPKNDELRAALAAAPLDRIMVETDAPYLPPHPYRGQPNAPYVAAHTVRAIAKILDRDLADVCARISRTTEEVYGAW